MVRAPQRPSGRLLIYGANGFVGQAASREAKARGFEPVLAGRDAAAIGELARELDLEHMVFGLGDEREVRDALSDATVVLNMAGPFEETYKPLVRACIEVG